MDLGDVVRERISYTVEPGERVPAYLFLPGDVGPGERRPGCCAPPARGAVPPGQERGRRAGRRCGAGVRPGAGAPWLRRAGAGRDLLRGARPAPGQISTRRGTRRPGATSSASSSPGASSTARACRRSWCGTCAGDWIICKAGRRSIPTGWAASATRSAGSRRCSWPRSTGGCAPRSPPAASPRCARCCARGSTTTSGRMCRGGSSTAMWATSSPGWRRGPFWPSTGGRPHLPHRRAARLVRRRPPGVRAAGARRAPGPRRLPRGPRLHRRDAVARLRLARPLAARVAGELVPLEQGVQGPVLAGLGGVGGARDGAALVIGRPS